MKDTYSDGIKLLATEDAAKYLPGPLVMYGLVPGILLLPPHVSTVHDPSDTDSGSPNDAGPDEEG